MTDSPCTHCEHCEQVFRTDLAEIYAKLDRLDEAIRGNGTPGIKRRLDRLEQADALRSRLMWVITGAAITGAASLLWRVLLITVGG